MPSRAESSVLIVFGANLRRERVAAKITQEQLAELVDLNIRTVQRIEAGETNILVTTALRIQLAIGCPWERLAAGVALPPLAAPRALAARRHTAAGRRA